MRFRLKYLLGNLDEGDDYDPYDDAEEEEPAELQEAFAVQPAERATLQQTLASYLMRICSIAGACRAEVEGVQGRLADMNAEDRGAALDLIEEHAVSSDAFLELVSDMVEEVKTKFSGVPLGRFEKSTTGWPTAESASARH